MGLFNNIVLYFHDITDSEWIESVFLTLRENYSLISINELEDFYYLKKHLKNSCHITFDDGYISFYEVVFPIIKKYNIPVTIFVSPSKVRNRTNFWCQETEGYDENICKKIIANEKNIDISEIMHIPLNTILKCFNIKDIEKIISIYQSKTGTASKAPQNMTIGQLKEVHESGLVAIGAHTQNHPILKNEIYEIAHKEIMESILDLSELLNERVKYFAYPCGYPKIDFDTREVDILNKLDIKIAFSTKFKTFSKHDNPLMIPRGGFSYGNKMFVLSKLIMGSKWDFVKKVLKRNDEIDYRINIRELCR